VGREDSGMYGGLQVIISTRPWNAAGGSRCISLFIK
jgi:hypothetical protein